MNGRLPDLPRLLLLAALLTLPGPAAGQAQPSPRTFRAEGSDLLMGVGAGAMGLGGAVVAGTGDVYSIYWNPAGLVEAGGTEVSVSRQLNAELVDVSFAGVALASDWLQVGGIRAALGLSWLTRLQLRAVGNYGPDDLETVFLKFALPGLPDSFDGTIRSKTRDYRLAVALTPVRNPRWSLGASLGYVDCRTAFCGMTAHDPGEYVVGSTDATAWAVNLGAKVFLTDRLTLGASLKDLDTLLDVKVRVTDSDGTRDEHFTTGFPSDLMVGARWKIYEDLTVELDYQTVFGEYGSSDVDFKMLRSGLERIRGPLALRLGLLLPLRIKSEFTGDVREKMPVPVGLTLGGGWEGDHLSVNLAVYPHPVMSYTRDRVYPAADVSVGWMF